jgi:hypothetical protein
MDLNKSLQRYTNFIRHKCSNQRSYYSHDRRAPQHKISWENNAHLGTFVLRHDGDEFHDQLSRTVGCEVRIIARVDCMLCAAVADFI